jgi:hypothetical protein
MWKGIRNWWHARKIRNATQREILLGERLAASAQDAAVWKAHYERLRQDFAALWDDHQELRARYADLQYARCQDAKLGRFQGEAAAA